ncbi:MAG: sensor histidine kinase, partial [Pseudomonadota bacterium]|nr:sensor histidine kinase [Pseudomonadota bacterium]
MKTSLRLRLLVLILVPLLVAAALGQAWQYRKSAQLAENVFDQKLSIMALAIYRDLFVTNGEQLSPATKSLFEEASDSQFFYHVRGPDGGFVTGYSPPPLRPLDIALAPNTPTLFTSSHRGQPVQVVQLMERAKIDGLEGLVLVSVWQDLQQRKTLATDLAIQSGLTALFLISTVFLVVFFGIRAGLQPLSSVEQAISIRSSTDLRPIRRNVPVEVQHIVQRLNNLFNEVTEEQAGRDRFISNAAHQLRNPIAAIQSLAEVAQDAPNLDEAKRRNAELLAASRSLARLTEQLLSYERLRDRPVKKQTQHFDRFIADILSGIADKVMEAGVELSFSGRCAKTSIDIDPVRMEQALLNII